MYIVLPTATGMLSEYVYMQLVLSEINLVNKSKCLLFHACLVKLFVLNKSIHKSILLHLFNVLPVNEISFHWKISKGKKCGHEFQNLPGKLKRLVNKQNCDISVTQITKAD